MSEKNAKFLVIDGSSLVYRAFYALPLLQTKQGLYTNAVYGFTAMLLRLLAEENPDYVAVAFDKAAPTFRHLEYSEYKAKREKAPCELSEQFPRIREVLAALKIPVEELEGYEADDLIGTLSRLANGSGASPFIVTGDTDIFQLIDLPAQVYYTRRGISQLEKYTAGEMMERYGLTAKQFIDYKGLKGDPSDNIPGVPGVGEKTARQLLVKYGSLEGIYENVEEVPVKLREKLKHFQDQAYLSRHLATIVTDVPLEFRLENYQRNHPDYGKLRFLFEQMEFKTLLDKLPGEPDSIPEKESTAEVFIEVKDAEDWRLLTAAAGNSMMAVFTDPAGSGSDRLHGITLAFPSVTFYIPHNDTGVPEAYQALLFLNNHRLTVTYDAKSWVNLCRRLFGKEPSGPLFDVSLAAYLLDPLENGYPLEKLSGRYLDRKLPARYGGKKKEEFCSREFCCAAVRVLFDLYPVLREKLAEFSLEKLYDELELPLVYTLARMERAGVAVDLETLAAMKEDTVRRMTILEQEIYSLSGEQFNLNSPKQLGHILFERLSLPAVKKTKTGYSTDAQVLEELAPRHEIVAKILEYRMLVKLSGTYLDGLSKLVNRETGCIHTTFNQTVTATGRLSSTEPNLQNIPIRLEEGRRIRRAFVPRRRERVLLSADYSQIELRILAHISRDSVLIESFRNEEDIHRRTAAEVFAIAPEDVTREMRDRAKAVNFGIIYGISDYGLSRQLGISRQESRAYIERYLERYPGVCEYIRSVVEDARRQGYVTTILNRRRYLPEINSRNFTQRSFAERTAMNTPIQGSAADIIKLAMLQVEAALRPFKDAASMILQVHDELVFEVEEPILAEVARLVREKMERAMELLVPLTVDLKSGLNWAEMIKLNE